MPLSVFDALQDLMDRLKARRTFNDITIEEITEANDPTRLPQMDR